MKLTKADLSLRVAHWRLRAEAAERALADLGVTPEEARAGAARSKANQRDAERYRWLRDEAWGGNNKRGPHLVEFKPGHTPSMFTELAEAAADAAIDAAMALHNARVQPLP